MSDDTLPPLPPGATMEETPPLPQGAVFGVYPEQRAAPSKPAVQERVKEFAGAVGGGALMGAAAPELTQYVGKGMQLYPPTRPLGLLVEPAGMAMKGARGTEMALGAVGGGTADIAGQIAKARGYGPTGQLVAEVAGGMAGPMFMNTLGMVISTSARKLLGLNPNAAVSSVIKDMGLNEAQISPTQKELIRKEVEKLRGQGGLAGVPQEELYRALQLGATDITKLAEQQAAQARAGGKAAMTEAEQRAAKLAGTAKKSEQIGAAEAEAAKVARAQVGQEREPSNIGNELREKINDLYGGQVKQRSDEYERQMAIRNAAVAEKENAGILVNSLPEYKSLVSDLRNKLLIGAEAQAQKTAPVTEPGVLKAYQNIYDAVTSRRVQVGVNEMGNPVYKTFPTSFQALDDVRRRLGDVAYGKEVEGYSAIGQKIAEKYYAKISEIQSKFAGEAHDVLQSEYEMASRLLEKYKGKVGKKVTALDRLDPARFMTDAAQLPGDFFRSKQSVEDLIELTGDRNFVIKNAADYAARQLRDLNAAGVKRWVNSNSDWLNVLPEIRTRVDIYQRGLERGERIAGKTEKAAGIIEAKGKEAVRAGERAVTEAEKEAGRITTEAQKRVETILGDKFPSSRVKELLLSGSRKQWNEAAPILASTPGGKEALSQAVYQVMADRAQTGLISAVQAFRNDVRPALESAGLMDRAALQQLENQLQAIANTAVGEPAKLTRMQTAIKNALIGVAAQPVGAGLTSAYDVINRRGQVGSVAQIPR